ncbi:MAG TPA: nucleoside triphosphate pyrophosphohydrolase [Candidatus Limnocylindria bacterium]|nr:nucleoside triphosphate pyrophosphohydrolase [Candidatus Limnocylindria bacterium]
MSASRVDLAALIAASGVDPGDGLQVVAVDALAGAAFDPSLPLLLLPARPAAIGGPSLPGRHARHGPHAVLAALYPASHGVRPLPDGAATTVGALDDGTLADGAWLVPRLAATDNLASPHGMAAISARLRAPDGCPWDARQTHLTLRPYLLEEAYETLDAIERGDPAALAEELGDLLLQVILHAQFAAEEGAFDLTDVYRSITSKIVRRHPHVFGGLEVDGVEQVLANWETIKAGERAERGQEAPSGAFSGVARTLPALPASREIQERASALGWDWDAIEGVWEKVGEELAELRAASTPEERLHEVGDLLFALVNLARWMQLDPEEALRAANRRWIERYERVEALAASRGVDLAALDLAGKDELWDEVKHADR